MTYSRFKKEILSISTVEDEKTIKILFKVFRGFNGTFLEFTHHYVSFNDLSV